MEVPIKFCLTLFLLVLQHTSADTEVCPDTNMYDSGTITSNNSMYSNCTFNLRTSQNSSDDVMILLFKELVLDKLDYLEVYDNTSALLGKYQYGTSPPHGVTTMKLKDGGPSLKLVLSRSSDTTKHGGFKATFETKTKKTFYGKTNFEEANGEVTSPGWPANYPLFSKKEYAVKVPHSNGKIKLSFANVSLGANTQVEIIYGVDPKQEAKRTITHDSKPDPISTDQKNVIIRFTAGKTGPTYSGFELEYQQYCVDKRVDMTCEQADMEVVKHTWTVVGGAIGVVLAIVVFALFIRWYIKRGGPRNDYIIVN